MLTKRIIPCLDVANGEVVKGTNFRNLISAGDAVALAKKYCAQGADELCFLDITATVENRTTVYELVEKVAQEISIPFSVGGGIRTLEDAKKILSLGAEKVVLGTIAIQKPEIISILAKEFGNQAVVISIDTKYDANDWFQYIKGGRENSGLKAVEFAKQVQKLGAGEILLNSIDKDGTQTGFDIKLCNAICDAVSIPVIASSGAKDPQSFVDVFTQSDVSAALAAKMFHFNQFTIQQVKEILRENGVEIR